MVSSAARPLQDQKTLVTGGSSGIGAATARAFARAGAAVGVNYRSKASAAEELVREIRDQGGADIGALGYGRHSATLIMAQLQCREREPYSASEGA